MSCLSSVGAAFVPIPAPMQFEASWIGDGNKAEGRVTVDKSLIPLWKIFEGELDLAFPRFPNLRGRASVGLELHIDPTLKPEEYTLTAPPIKVVGGSYAAVAMGTVTLLQLLRSTPKGLVAPNIRIRDEPAKGYRGLMIDVARRYHSIDTLKQCVEMCRLYKVRYLQLHLTDDQSFMMPCESFPKLNSKNANGAKSYTKQEMIDLIRYADERGVTIVPEIEMPGHAGTMVRNMPDLFKITGTKPYVLGSTLNFANDRVLAALEKIIGEACDLFASSPYFHMGGDEADISLADQNPDFKAAFARFGLELHGQQEIFRRFIGQVDAIVKKHGKRLIVWEGFGQNQNSKFAIPKDVTVMEFESAYYLPNDLLADGYNVINAAWTPLYALNEHVWPPEKVYNWNVGEFGRFSTLYKTVEWFQAPETSRIEGAQVCEWEEPEELDITNLRRILPAMAERVWNPHYKGSYREFVERLKGTDEILDKLIHPVEITCGDLVRNGPDDFDVPSFFPSLEISLQGRGVGEVRYTLDGSLPTVSSPIYKGPFSIQQTTTVRAASFNDGVCGFENAIRFYYREPKIPNLATGKKVTVSGGTQGAQTPDLAVDDNLDLGSSWWASPAPQWLKVDLGKAYSVDRIQVYPYWDGARYYQYTVEASIDDVHWTMIADRSQNTIPSTPTGDEIKFPKQSMRFVKVNMLKNSANEGVHLVELKVWQAK